MPAQISKRFLNLQKLPLVRAWIPSWPSRLVSINAAPSLPRGPKNAKETGSVATGRPRSTASHGGCPWSLEPEALRIAKGVATGLNVGPLFSVPNSPAPGVYLLAPPSRSLQKPQAMPQAKRAARQLSGAAPNDGPRHTEARGPGLSPESKKQSFSILPSSFLQNSVLDLEDLWHGPRAADKALKADKQSTE